MTVLIEDEIEPPGAAGFAEAGLRDAGVGFFTIIDFRAALFELDPMDDPFGVAVAGWLLAGDVERGFAARLA